MSLDAAPSRVHGDTPKHRPSAAPRLLVELRRRSAESADGTAVATTADLAWALDVDRRTIQRAQLDLVETELIEVVDSGESRHAPNTYRVL